MADIPAGWRNVGTGFTDIEKGEPVPIEVEGGWMRMKAPAPGSILAVSGGTEIYVPEAVFAARSIVMVCGIERCSSERSEVEFVGTICRLCWLFASGLDGGERSQAYRNAVAAGRRRRATPVVT